MWVDVVRFVCTLWFMAFYFLHPSIHWPYQFHTGKVTSLSIIAEHGSFPFRVRFESFSSRKQFFPLTDNPVLLRNVYPPLRLSFLKWNSCTCFSPFHSTHENCYYYPKTSCMMRWCARAYAFAQFLHDFSKFLNNFSVARSALANCMLVARIAQKL